MSPACRPAAGPPGSATFRQVLGSFCSGVTVVAALGREGPLGLTCQAFASLSLDPPLILISPSRASVTWPEIRRIGRFCISILAEEHQPVSVQMSRSGTDKFTGIPWEQTPLGSPRVTGAAAWLDCTLQAEHDGGDHTVVIAAVHHLSADPAARPLLYHHGRYAQLARSTPAPASTCP